MSDKIIKHQYLKHALLWFWSPLCNLECAKDCTQNRQAHTIPVLYIVSV